MSFTRLQQKKKVLITGANGFIGRALCVRMLDEGWNVRGTVRHLKKLNSFPAGVNAIQVESIGPDTDWSKALLDVNCVVHLAANVHIMKKTPFDSLTTIHKVNVKGSEHLAREAASANVKRFVYMSSVKVNGEGTEAGGQKSEVRYRKAQLKMAFSENDNPEPRDAYGISKWEAEQVLQEIAEETGMEIVILRSPLVYGPNVKANFLRLLKVVDYGIPLPLASIKNRRSFIYLENLIDAVVTCIIDSKASGQTYFVSDGEDVSTPELVRRISSALGKPTRLFPFPPILLKMAGIITGKSVAIDRLLRSLTIDCSKIRRELEWQAPFSMDQGLKETAEWYNKQRSEVRGRMSVS